MGVEGIHGINIIVADPYKYQKSYDVVNEYDWTSVSRRSPMRNEAPSVYISAYNLEFSQLRTFIDGYINVLSPTHGLDKKAAPAKDPGMQFYRNLYGTGTSLITRLNLPFFTDNIRAFTTEFADTFSPVSQRGAQMMGGEFMTGLGAAGESVLGGAAALASNIANIGAAAENAGNKSVIDKVSKAAIRGTNKAFNLAFGLDVDFQKNEGLQTIGAPGTYIETPKFYQYSPTDSGLEISFALSNTLNDDSIRMNKKFIKDFTRMNRPYRTGSIGMTFPAIYNIVLPGQRYIQWASLESFNINMIGMRRRIRLPNGGSEVVPEGYTCNFNFRSLTLEAANFLDYMDQYGSFTEGTDSYAALKEKEEALMTEQKNKMIQMNAKRLNRLAKERGEPVDGRGYTDEEGFLTLDHPKHLKIHGSGPGTVHYWQKQQELKDNLTSIDGKLKEQGSDHPDYDTWNSQRLLQQIPSDLKFEEWLLIKDYGDRLERQGAKPGENAQRLLDELKQNPSPKDDVWRDEDIAVPRADDDGKTSGLLSFDAPEVNIDVEGISPEERALIRDAQQRERNLLSRGGERHIEGPREGQFIDERLRALEQDRNRRQVEAWNMAGWPTGRGIPSEWAGRGSFPDTSSNSNRDESIRTFIQEHGGTVQDFEAWESRDFIGPIWPDQMD